MGRRAGIADPARICIYGSSYGGYAALEGVAKSPLYKCAAGYVGVYDLPLMFSKGDTRELESGRNYMHDWIGEPSELGKVSPVNQAASIKVPVFLAAGGEDERAPIEHSERMEKALRAAGVPVETMFIRTEGHGFLHHGTPGCLLPEAAGVPVRQHRRRRDGCDGARALTLRGAMRPATPITTENRFHGTTFPGHRRVVRRGPWRGAGDGRRAVADPRFHPPPLEYSGAKISRMGASSR